MPLVIQQAEIESRCLVSVTPTFYDVRTAQTVKVRRAVLTEVDTTCSYTE